MTLPEVEAMKNLNFWEFIGYDKIATEFYYRHGFFYHHKTFSVTKKLYPPPNILFEPPKKLIKFDNLILD